MAKKSTTAAPLEYVSLTLAKLDSVIKDPITELKGMLTHAWINADDSIRYVFQPYGVNPREGEPVDRILLDPTRIPAETPTGIYDIPKCLFGKTLTDRASGLSGVVVCFDIHLDGCVHAYLQPKGCIDETKQPYKWQSFDLRRLDYSKGVPVISPEERDKVEATPVQKRPSPSPGGVRQVF